MKPSQTFRPTRRAMIAGAAAVLMARGARAQTGPMTLRAAEEDLSLGGDVMRTALLNGAPAGPTLAAEAGKAFSFRVENALAFPVSFRMQGVRVPSPENAASIAPGETRTIALTAPDAGSFTYRLEADEPEQAVRALLLSGPMIVRGDETAVADRDVLVGLNTLALSGPTPDAPPQRMVLVNGGSDLAVSARPGERLRLRLINLAARGIAPLKLPTGARIAALDGQPCAPFPAQDDLLLLPPLGRADVLVDMPAAGSEPLIIGDDMADGRPLVRLTAEGEAQPARSLAERLVDNSRLPAAMPFKKAVRANLVPGKPVDRTLLRAGAGQTIILTAGSADTLHALLIEGQSARLLDGLDDGWKPWWTDSLLLFPGETHRLAFVPPAAGRFAISLIPLESADPVSRTWIEII